MEVGGGEWYRNVLFAHFWVGDGIVGMVLGHGARLLLRPTTKKRKSVE